MSPVDIAADQAEEGIRERYAAGGLLGRIEPGSAPAVVVVDLQYGFTEAHYGPGFDLDAVVSATRTLLDTAREAAIPVFFTTIAFPADSDGMGATWLRKMPAMQGLRVGSRSVQIDDRLGKRADEPLVTKQTASAFAHTDLASQLEMSGVDTVLLAGATTSGCIRATAVDACAGNLPVFVVRDCVGDRETVPHQASLLDIAAKYGEVIELRTALSAIRGTS